jgi:hypothetical protein
MTAARKEIVNDDVATAEVNAPGGWSAKWRSSNQLTMVTLIVILTSMIIGYGLWVHDKEAAIRSGNGTKSDAATRAAVEVLTNTVKEQEKKIDVVIYVLTLDEQQRKALNLSKPQALRDMQR